MSRPDFSAETTDESDVQITADREAVFQLRNHVFAGYFDGQYPSTHGEDARDAIPEPDDNVTSLTFEVSADTVVAIAQAIEYGAAVAERDGRSSTRRRMTDEADRLRAAARDALGY